MDDIDNRIGVKKVSIVTHIVIGVVKQIQYFTTTLNNSSVSNRHRKQIRNPSTGPGCSSPPHLRVGLGGEEYHCVPVNGITLMTMKRCFPIIPVFRSFYSVPMFRSCVPFLFLVTTLCVLVPCSFIVATDCSVVWSASISSSLGISPDIPRYPDTGILPDTQVICNDSP